MEPMRIKNLYKGARLRPNLRLVLSWSQREFTNECEEAMTLFVLRNPSSPQGTRVWLYKRQKNGTRKFAKWTPPNLPKRFQEGAQRDQLGARRGQEGANRANKADKITNEEKG